jgi:uncharacterized membrane protein HdeD (DUF308 family)
MLIVLSGNWRTLALRGVASILFGIVALLLPGPTLAAIAMLFGAFVIVDGVLAIVLAVRGMKGHDRWGGMIVRGILSIAAGVIIFLHPPIVVLAFMYIIAAWALASGIAEIFASRKLRRAEKGEWLLLSAGIFTVLLGVLTLINPGMALKMFVGFLAIYAIVYGGMLLILADRERKALNVVES